MDCKHCGGDNAEEEIQIKKHSTLACVTAKGIAEVDGGQALSKKARQQDAALLHESSYSKVQAGDDTRHISHQ